MWSALKNHKWRIVVAVSTYLTGLFTLLWLGSLFYFTSFTFLLPPPFEETRIEAGYGMLYLTLNARMDPTSRWKSHGIVEFPKFHRDRNVKRLLELRFPQDDLYGEATACGFRRWTHEYQLQTSTYSRYWCSAPIPCILLFVFSTFSFIRWRCISCGRPNSELKANRKQDVVPELPIKGS
ncbi:MAG: hypothetical protein ACK50J_09425 [Planctomyces sp.]